MAKPFNADFGTREDWSTRISNSWVRYEDEFVYVRDVSQELNARDRAKRDKLHSMEITTQRQLNEQQDALRKLRRTTVASINRYDSDGKAKTSTVPVKSLDLSSFRLGFINVTMKGRSSCAYLSRIPARQYKHGVTSRNTTLQHIPDCIARTRDSFHQSKRILDMFNNNYPSVTECLDTLFEQDDCNSLAFDRDFAVRVDEFGHTMLYNRNVRIGYLGDDDRFMLLRRFGYLRESLTEKGVNFVS